MKKLLIALAAGSLFAVPASAESSSHPERDHYEQRVDHSDHWRDGQERRVKRDRRFRNWTFDVIINPRRPDRLRSELHCPSYRSYLTVRGLDTRRGKLIINGRRYRPDYGLCLRDIRRGDFVFHDINNNRRHDHYEPRGIVTWDRWPRRSGYYGEYYRVDLR